MAKKFRFELTIMHPGGGTFARTVIAEQNVYDAGVYHFYNGDIGCSNHHTVSCFPISCTIIESETEIEDEVAQPEATRNKINHQIT